MGAVETRSDETNRRDPMSERRLIEKLTPAQERKLPKFRREWWEWGTCTKRADRAKAEAAILAMRAEIGNTTKPIFVWCDLVCQWQRGRQERPRPPCDSYGAAAAMSQACMNSNRGTCAFIAAVLSKTATRTGSAGAPVPAHS
jgi:hypothetical protein